MKIKQFDLNSAGFIKRERKRLAKIEAGQTFFNSNKLEDQVNYFDALVEFLSEYVDASIDEIEEFSLKELTELDAKVTEMITGKETPDPKKSGSSGDG